MLERFQISFKAALIILTLLLIFIPALIILPWMDHYHYNIIKNNAVESEFLQSKWLLKAVETEVEKSVDYVSKDALSLASVLSKEPVNFQTLNHYLKETLISRKAIDSLYLINSKQKFLAGLDSKNLEASDLLAFNYSDSLQQHVLRLITLAQGTSNAEPVILQENNRLIILAPVFHKTNLKGILIANIKASYLLSLIKDNFKSENSGVYASYYYMVNNNGEVFSNIFKLEEVEEQSEVHSLIFNTLYKDAGEKLTNKNGPYLLESDKTIFIG